MYYDYLDTPAVPHDVQVIDIQAKQFTVVWKSPKCELDLDYLQCFVNINVDGAESRVRKLYFMVVGFVMARALLHD